MKIKVLVINVTARPDHPYYSTGPAATYTKYEHERNYGFYSIRRSDIDIKHMDIVWSPFQGFSNLNRHQLLSTIVNGNYDVVHFYFEDTNCIILHWEFWDPVFSKVTSKKNAYGIRSYIFTDHHANLLLHEVLNGLKQEALPYPNNFVSEDYIQFCDDLRQCQYDQVHRYI